MKKSKKIKIQLLIVLGFFTLAAVSITLVSLYYFQRVHEVYEVSSTAHRMHDSYMDVINAEQKFIYLETNKADFFRTGRSLYLDAFNSDLDKTRKEMRVLKSRSAYRDFEIDRKVEALNGELSRYETLFSFTVDKIRNRGFKDYGVEGKMRNFVHELENHSHQIGLANVLMLRRHEKDFLLRNDESYVTKLRDKVASIKSRIWKNSRLNNAQKDTLIMLLHNYEYSFIELVNSTKEIGHRNEQGMTELLGQSTFQIDAQFDSIDESILKKESSLVEYIKTILMIIIFNIVVVAVFTIYLYTRKIPEVSSLLSRKESAVMTEHFSLIETVQ